MSRLREEETHSLDSGTSSREALQVVVRMEVVLLVGSMRAYLVTSLVSSIWESRGRR